MEHKEFFSQEVQRKRPQTVGALWSDHFTTWPKSSKVVSQPKLINKGCFSLDQLTNQVTYRTKNS